MVFMLNDGIKTHKLKLDKNFKKHALYINYFFLLNVIV